MVTCENDPRNFEGRGSPRPGVASWRILSNGATSLSTNEVNSSGESAAAPGSVAPPTKLVNRTCPSGARPGNNEEFQTVPRTRNPADRGTKKPNPARG